MHGPFDPPRMLTSIIQTQLKLLGLSQATAFACLFDFLYRPTKKVVKAMRPQLPPLLDPGAVKVIPVWGGGSHPCHTRVTKL